ncbi:MAG: site-specific DNA-methyltransferase [bacterium]
MAKENKKLEIENLKAEVERLKKELKKRKKYGLVWEEKPEEVVEMCKEKLPVLKEVKDKEIITDKNKPVNLLIEGDNYHALSVLNYTHPGKIDVIYIDPPFNTGARDWKYNNDYVDINDAWRHSKWLSMMGHRLRLARNLLKENGVFVCAIDDNEFYRLGLLLEEIFKGFEIHCITIVHNPRGVQGNNFSYTHEYAYFVFRKGLRVIEKRKIQPKDIDWRNLRDNGGESLRTDAKNCFYPIIVKDDEVIGFGDVLPNEKHPKSQTEKVGDAYYIYPIDRNKIERKWRYARQSIEEVKNLLRTRRTRTGYEIEIGKDFGTVRTVWQDSRYDANEYGTKLVHALVPNTHFDFPKSIWNTYDCIAPILYSRKNAIVLDYFAGSGTTAHALLLLNKEDSGERKFILCTNNENDIAEEVCWTRIKRVIEGHKDYPDITGIPANLKYFKTDFVDYDEPTDSNKIKLTQQATEMLCVKEGTFEKVLDNERFKVFKNSDYYTGIIWDQTAIPAFKKAIKDIKGKFSVYVFSLGDETFDDEFKDVKQKVQLSPIPEAILRVYRRIFK